MRALVALALVAAAPLAWGGAQQREQLPEEIRLRLEHAVTDRPAPRLVFHNNEDGHRWLDAMSRRLEPRIPDRKLRLELLRTVHFEALRAGLDPQLVLGLIEVESGFKKYAVSRAGARGYMQVMPFWTSVARRPKDNLFHLRTNLIYGCWILRHYLTAERGDYFRALGRYNGSLGQAEYPGQVVSAWRGRWKYDGPNA